MRSPRGTTTNIMKFKINNHYRGLSAIGTCDIEVISRTAKFLTIKTCFGINRVKIKTASNGTEYSLFKSWGFDATDVYTHEQAREDAYDAAYCS